jgi:hypothetical protein
MMGWKQLRLPVAVLLVTLLAACGRPGEQSSSAGALASADAGSSIVAQVASYQLVAKRPGRLMVAILSADNRWVSFGSTMMSFAYLGSKAGTPRSDGQVPPVRAAFLPIPGTPQGAGRPSTLTAPADGRGLYAVEPITFPVAGYWQVTASGELDDGTAFSADAAFEVLSKPVLPMPGDRALKSDNPLIGAADASPAAIDSRAVTEGKIPDPELHSVSIAQAISAGHPALVVFSTPVYCVSRFCGPVTDMVADLAHRYAGRADFIHVEIYEDFDAGKINRTASEWLQAPDGELREPWVFLIGADGRIDASWDTMVTRDEIEPLLRALPKRK